MNYVRKELRRSLASIPESASVTDSVRGALVASLRALKPNSIGIYYPLERWKEISLLFLEEAFPGICAFPRTSLSEMSFHLAKSGELETNKDIHDLREPPAGRAIVVPEIIFAPATACDHRGHRVGKGGGYYDRFLNSHPECLAIGVVDDRCLHSAFAPEWVQSHDHPVAFVLTQTQYFSTKEGPQ